MALGDKMITPSKTVTIKYLKSVFLEVVVAQLTESSLPKPDVRGSNPDIADFFRTIIYLLSTEGVETTKIEKIRAGIFHNKISVILKMVLLCLFLFIFVLFSIQWQI